MFVNITPLVEQEDSISHHQVAVETTALQKPFNKNNISTQNSRNVSRGTCSYLETVADERDMEKKEQEQERIKSEIERLKKELLQKEMNTAKNTSKETW